MRNKDLHVANQGTTVMACKEKIPEIMAMKQEIDRLKEKISELQLADRMKWSTSAIEVTFRNEVFANKYKSRVERFLTNLLEGESFLVDYKICKNQEQEIVVGPNDSFCIDKIHGELSSNGSLTQTVPPVYATSFEEVLHADDSKVDTEEKEEVDDKCQGMTCFNCLGNHHMKNCPEEIDRLRIAANRKDYQSNSSRYHEEEQLNSRMKPGKISNALREALGLKPYQIPLYIYHMRVLGYPPGWMQEAVFETSGLSLYDFEGKAVANDCTVAISREAKYDGTKFVDFPGFNTAVPNGYRDEWQDLKMPPIQSHQQLSRALKSSNTINGVNMYKRKQTESECNGDVKKKRDTPGDLHQKQHNRQQPHDSRLTPSIYRNNIPTSQPKPKAGGTPLNPRSSLSVSPGTPIMEQGNPFKRLPLSDKFATGITEHIPYENLPDAVGTFEKMRGILGSLHEKQSNLFPGSS